MDYDLTPKQKKRVHALKKILGKKVIEDIRIRKRNGHNVNTNYQGFIKFMEEMLISNYVCCTPQSWDFYYKIACRDYWVFSEMVTIYEYCIGLNNIIHSEKLDRDMLKRDIDFFKKRIACDFIEKYGVAEGTRIREIKKMYMRIKDYED